MYAILSKNNYFERLPCSVQSTGFLVKRNQKRCTTDQKDKKVMNTVTFCTSNY